MPTSSAVMTHDPGPLELIVVTLAVTVCLCVRACVCVCVCVCACVCVCEVVEQVLGSFSGDKVKLLVTGLLLNTLVYVCVF